MKRRFIALLTVLILTLPVGLACAETVVGAENGASADTTVYQLESLGVALNLPSAWRVLIRETSKDDDYLAIGLDPEATRASFDAGNVALWAVPTDASTTFTLSAETFEDEDYSGLGMVQLHLMLGLWRQQLLISGGTADHWKVFDSSDSKWLCMAYSMGSLSALQYESVDRNTKLDIRLVSPNPIDEVQEILMDSVVYHCRVKGNSEEETKKGEQ